MNKQLSLAVNHALKLRANASVQESALARARALVLNPGGVGLDAKRSSAWCEYGFKETILISDFVNLYRRGGIAHGAINKLVGHCWKTDPWVIEGEKQDEARDETKWEKSFKAALPESFWHSVAEADMRRLVCRFSALVLRIKDSKKFDQPVIGSHALVEAVPVWAGALKVGKYDSLGNPLEWQYTPTRADGASLPVLNIHPDRIILLGDYSADAIGFLEPAYNAFVSLEKVEGGSGEAFLKNAARQIGMNFEKDIDFANLASMYGVNVQELQERFNEAAKEINRGNDSMLITQGAQVTPLVANVPDPKPTYEVNLQTAAAALDIPTKILVGMQTGERASSEDQKYFNARCQSRRVRDLGRDIRGIVHHLLRVNVLEPVSQFTVMWDDLAEATLGEKLANAKTMADINTAAMSTGQPIFKDDEIRVAGGHEPWDGDAPLADQEPEDEEEAQASNPAA